MNRKEMAEEIRLRALYRRLALRANIDGNGFKRLPVSALKGLVGPDCAYHLYGSLPSAKKNLDNKDEK